MPHVDPLRTVGLAQRVLRVGNTDDRQTAAARQHWTGVHSPRFTTIKCYSIYITNVRSPPLFREKSEEASAHIGLNCSYHIVGGDWSIAQRCFFIAVWHPLASAASLTPPKILLREKTLRNKKTLEQPTPRKNTHWQERHHWRRSSFPWELNPEEPKQNLGATSS